MPLPISLLPTPPTTVSIKESSSTTTASVIESTCETTDECVASPGPDLLRAMDVEVVPDVDVDNKDISSMSVKELRNLCVTRGLVNTGKKTELLGRLQNSTENEVALIDDV